MISKGIFDLPYLALAVPGFSPAPGMAAWWKTDSLLGTADNTLVTSLIDSSGNGNTLTSSGATYRTNKLNGLPGLDYTIATGSSAMTGPSSFWTATSNPPDGVHTFTVFCVYWTSSGTEHVCVQGSNNFWVLGSLSGNHSFFDGNGWFGTVPVVANQAVIADVKQIGSGVGAGAFQRINGANAASDPTTPGPWSRVCFSGLGADTHMLDGFWFETLLYASALSLSDIQKTENYLNHKYAIF